MHYLIDWVSNFSYNSLSSSFDYLNRFFSFLVFVTVIAGSFFVEGVDSRSEGDKNLA